AAPCCARPRARRRAAATTGDGCLGAPPRQGCARARPRRSARAAAWTSARRRAGTATRAPFSGLVQWSSSGLAYHTRPRHARCTMTARAGTLALLLCAVPAQSHETAPPRDGQHDFDFEIGTWKTRLRRLQRPLTGSTTWLEYEGTSVVRKIWNGRANLVELEADGPTGHLQVLSLRLYNPQARQWSLHYANSNDGTLSQPTIGEFKNGRG